MSSVRAAWNYLFGKTDQITAWLLGAAAFSLAVRTKTVVKPSDLLIVFLGVVAIANPDFRAAAIKLWRELAIYSVLFFLIIAFVFFAQVISYRNGVNQELNFGTVINYARVAFNAFLFLLVGTLIASKRKFLRAVTTGLLALPLIALPAYWAPWQQFFTSGKRLSGLLQTPVMFSILATTAFTMGLALFLSMKKGWKRQFLAVWLVVIANQIIWTGSRAAWLSMVLVLAVWIFIYIKQKRPWGAIKYLFFIPLVVFPLGYLVLVPTTGDSNIHMWIAERAINFITEPSYNQSHAFVWQNTISIIKQNPIGFGFGDAFLGNLLLRSNGLLATSTNTFLEVALYGGIGAFIALIAILLKIISQAWLAVKNSSQRMTHIEMAWVVIIPAIYTELFFTAGFLLRLAWFLLGIILGVIWSLSRENTHVAKKYSRR